MTSAPASDPVRTGEDAPDPARWRALAVVMAAGAMTLLDVSIVNVALPTLREGLGADDSDIQWIVAGYSLAFGVVLVPMGRLGDARSRRTIFMIGVALFTLASAAAGLAPNPTLISVARVVQGIGGGIITPQVSGFIQNLFRGRDRAKAFSIFGATIGLSTAAGPLLGGLLVALGGESFGWRLVFFVNVPIGIAVILVARKLLPGSAPSNGRQSLDPVGVLLFAAAVLLVLWPLVEGTQGAPLSSRPWWLVGVAVVLGIAFLLWERSWGRRGRETLVNLRLLKVPAYIFGLSLGTFYFAGFTAVFLVVTLYLQVGLGYSALQAGLTTTPFAVGAAVSALVSGRLVERFGRWLAVFGLTVVGVGLLAIDLLVPHLSGMVGLKLAPAFLVAGLGGGFVVTPNVTLTLAEVDPAEAGSGGGMLQTAQRVGSAIGVAVILAQFFAALGSSQGDYAEALSVALRTTVVAVAVALAFAVADLLRRTSRDRHPEPQHAAEDPAPRHAA